MKLFGYDVTKAAKPVFQPSDEVNPEVARRVLGTIVNPWEIGSGQEIFHQEDYLRLIEAYKSWIYICANKNATAVAEAPLRLYVSKPERTSKLLVKTVKVSKINKDRLSRKANLNGYVAKAVDVEEVMAHPFITLMKAVNPLINRFDLWELTQIWLELTGNAYWYVYKDKLGVPQEVWPIAPQFMRIVVSPDKIIGGYVYQRSIAKIPFEADEIIHFRFGNPSGSIYGTSPLSAVFETYVSDGNIRNFESTLMKNAGRPEGVLQTTATIGPEVFKRLKEEWGKNYAGVRKVGKTIILENGLEYKPITFTPREMNYVVGRKMNREEIAAAFGIPMSKLTTDSVNRSNAVQGNYQYFTDTVEPRLRRIEEKINEQLMPLYDENLFVAYDSTVPEDKEFELRERRAHLGSYVTTVNEERVKIGLEPVDWGDIPLVSGGVAPLGSQQQPGAVPGGGKSGSEKSEPGVDAIDTANAEGDLEGLSDEELDVGIAALEESLNE